MAIDVQTDVPLAEHTTLKTGGLAAKFVAVHSERELEQVFTSLRAQNERAVVLGGGSNVLVADTGIADTVVKIRLMGREAEVSDAAVLLTVGAGETLDEVVAYTVNEEWWGLENLSHIPGSVGATPVQNVGAYGVEVADLITKVRVFDTHKLVFKNLTPKQCRFSYRDSIFKSSKGKHLIVVSVTYRLSPTPQPQLTYRDLAKHFADTPHPELDEVREAVIEIRSKKFPNWHEVGTAGSFFKNPIVSADKFAELKATFPELPGYEQADGSVKIALGWVLDKILQLKGEGTETVRCYQGQALVLINRGEATAQEIKAFADEVVKKVDAAIGVKVEWEVTPLGFEVEST